MNKPSVTIGIVTFNRMQYLPTAIRSALAQGDLVDEVLVVDDGSSDGTPEYVRGLGDPKIRCVVHEKNGGRPVARNTTVENMRCDFLLWLDDDDALVEGAVQSHLECLQRSPAADIIYCDHVRCDMNLAPQEVTPSKTAEPGQMLMNLVYENIIPNGGSFIRRSVFDRVGRYYESEDRSYRYEDFELFARAAVAGCVFVHNQQPLYHFRFHADNLANPEINRDQSRNHCLIVQSILASANLEDVYPVFPWKEKPQESGATAMTLLARIFFDHGDDQSALECLEYAEQFISTQRARLMRAYVLRSMGRAAESADAFASVVKEIDPELAYLDVEIGAPRGSRLNAERARIEREAREKQGLLK